MLAAIAVAVALCSAAQPSVARSSASAPGPRRSWQLAGTPPARAAQARAAPVVYAVPVSPLRVVRGFDPPPIRYAAGHLGVDLATSPGQVVTSAGDGVVSFAGSVAGRGVIVVQHADGVSTEYEPVRPTASVGTALRRGAPLGVVNGTHGTCAASRCLHWGARRGAEYLDPLLLLRPLAAVRLLPWTG